MAQINPAEELIKTCKDADYSSEMQRVLFTRRISGILEGRTDRR